MIDTSDISIHQLKARLNEDLIHHTRRTNIVFAVVSFGYKYGIPIDADLLFDVRFLPNPHYDLRLRPLTGLDDEVRDFVMQSAGTGEYLERLFPLLDFLFPRYAAEGKAHLTIGVGCTGGRHRSVAIAQLIGERYEKQGYYTVVRHRDLTRLDLMRRSLEWLYPGPRDQALAAARLRRRRRCSSTRRSSPSASSGRRSSCAVWAWAGCTTRHWAAVVLAFDGVVLGAIAAVHRRAPRLALPAHRPRDGREIRAAGRLARGPRVVAVGGGNGLAALLRGLKSHTSNLTAVVTMADDGGSSGLLRRDMGMPPPGDLRNCLVALADDESMMSQLFQYRFPDDGGLQGHSFGNLFMAALAEVTGDFERAVQESTHVLKVRGRVLPSTLDDVVLHAQLEGGDQVSGESTITAAERLPRRVWLTPAAPRALPQAIAALRRGRSRRPRPRQPLHERHPQPADPRGARRPSRRRAAWWSTSATS